MNARFLVLGLLALLAGCTQEASTVPGPEPDADAFSMGDGQSSNDGFAPADVSSDIFLTDTGEETFSNDATVLDTGEEPCLTDDEYFIAKVWEPILSPKCVVCHRPEGIAKASRLVFVNVDSAEALQLNFETTKELALDLFGGESTLLLKPTNTHPLGHTGGEQIIPNSQEHLVLKHLVERLNGTTDACEAETTDEATDCSVVPPSPRQLRRLSHAEYDRTVTDLFGFAASWGAAFTVDDFEHGFDNHGASLGVSPLLADQYRKAAEAIAVKVLENKGSLFPCVPAAGQEAECALSIIDSLGRNIFRRTLSADDTLRYEGIYNLAAADDGFDAGMFWVLSAMLQSPHFLYRPELGEHVGEGLYRLNPFEIASELSYFLWGTQPDATLMALASSGELLDPAVILAQTERLLASPRRLDVMRHFVAQWLDTRQLHNATKDPAMFPGFTEAVRESMSEGTARFMGHVVFESTGNLTEVFTAPYGVMNTTLADFYGLDGSSLGQGFDWMDLAGTPYAGILSQGSVLGAHSFSNSTSPIHRGVMVRERLLCQELPPPPPGIVVQVPPIDPNMTTRERFAAHSEEEPCTSCHQLIDPLGFGFEHFDAVGRYREAEGGESIDASGEIIGSLTTDAAFIGLDDLSSLLASSTDVHDCFALQWVRFAYGMGKDEGIGCLIRQVQGGFQASERHIPTLLRDLTQTKHFLEREGELPPTPVDEEPGEDTVVDAGSESDVGLDAGPDPALVDVEFKVVSEWGTGYCADVVVSNASSETLIWSFVMAIEGEISNIWNAEAKEVADGLEFKGVSWNQELAPDASASFGFCASK